MEEILGNCILGKRLEIIQMAMTLLDYTKLMQYLAMYILKKRATVLLLLTRR